MIERRFRNTCGEVSTVTADRETMTGTLRGDGILACIENGVLPDDLILAREEFNELNAIRHNSLTRTAV